MNNQITICTCVSPNWLKYTVIQLRSILKNNTSNSPIKFYVFTDTEDITDEHIDMFRKLVDRYKYTFDILFVDIKEAFDKMITSDKNITSRFTRYTLYRAFIPMYLEEDKILYLDADTVVCGDLSNLFNLDMKDWLNAGVIDSGIMPNHKSDIGMDNETNYYNNGVILINNKKIREENLIENWIKMLNETEYLGLDQDVWNKTMSHMSTELNPVYNVSVSTVADIPEQFIKVMHYAGKDKPWDDVNVFNGHIWKQLHDEVFG